MNDSILATLESKIEQLVRMCDQLREENRQLHAKESEWIGERTRLIEKNELARTRVEAMIARLKSLESEA
ncbi:TIGR02449 family protein [Aurantivibrio plasticivorans]